MQQVIIELKGVTKSFAGQFVLRGLDLVVYAGETLVIIGKSGAGKSVITRHMIGLVAPDSGGVFVFGKDLSTLTGEELDKVRLRMGYLFQSGALLNWMTLRENVMLPLLEHCGSISWQERETIVREKLALVGLEDAMDKYPGEISGGMKKRAALARAIVLNPEVIFYDEPTSGLDPVIARTIDGLVVETQVKTGATQIVVTHDMESAYRVGHRIAFLHDGAIRFCGTPLEIRESRDAVVSQFVRGEVEPGSSSVALGA